MVHIMVRLARVDPGFDPHNLQTVMFALDGPQCPTPRGQVFYGAMVERLRALPGVENAAITSSLPILGSNWWTVFNTQGKTAEHWISVGEFPNADTVLVTASYFDTLRIPLVRPVFRPDGHTPDSAPVAIVSSNVARKFWPNEDPLESKSDRDPGRAVCPWRTIVGIVGDVRQQGVDRNTTPQLFPPVVQEPRATVFTIVCTRETASPYRSRRPSTRSRIAMSAID